MGRGLEWKRYKAKKHTQLRKPCSGPCCGNPRKWDKELTMQEKRQDEKDRTQMMDC